MNIRTWIYEDKIFIMKSITKFYVIGASENICKWILMSFLEKLFWKKGKYQCFFGKEIKRKVGIRMHYSQAEIDIPPKITLKPEFFLPHWGQKSLQLHM